MLLSHFSDSIYRGAYNTTANQNRNINDNTNNANLVAQEPKTTQLSNEEARQKINELLINPENSSLELNFSLITNDSFVAKRIECESKVIKQSANKIIPSDLDFQTSFEYLLTQINEILVQGLKENPNSLEFQNLLAVYKTNETSSKDWEGATQHYLNCRQSAQEALSAIKSGSHKEDFNQIMSEYMSASFVLESAISNFFYCANQFGMLSQNQQNKIADALDTAQVYLLNQSGFSESKSFQLGNAIIAWNGNESPFRDYSDGIVQITFLESDILASLSSNFDSSQTFFEVLEQRDKIEKENQKLKNKETLCLIMDYHEKLKLFSQ
ncbi:hypothetical protein [Helicobacter rodentium]|uniref:hypothetical protein n=1 Tax=Helicobacter rodentium TaxID=59617 RepID=UPI00235782BF|nr:hypothetical protein [Helicobacter rodentium]